MKNKKTAWFLLPVVLAIWGIIAWKAYAALGGNDKSALVQNPSVEKTNNEEVSDTFHLIADYRDPFLDQGNENADPKKNKRDSKVQIVKQQIIPVKQSQWPSLAYHGLVKKSDGKKTVGFLCVNGKGYFVQGGDAAGEINVGRIWKDSVEVFFGRERRTLNK